MNTLPLAAQVLIVLCVSFTIYCISRAFFEVIRSGNKSNSVKPENEPEPLIAFPCADCELGVLSCIVICEVLPDFDNPPEQYYRYADTPPHTREGICIDCLALRLMPSD